jgi:DNA-binding transcriptional MerR regulator
MAVGREWTLSEATRLLRQPQHRLIYLCEKGAVAPDLGDASGRGSSRRFSARNLLEFAVALKLRELGLSVDAVKAILYALRSFQETIRQELPDFDLAMDLRRQGAPTLRVLVSDGPRVHFSLQGRGGKQRLFGGVPLSGASPRRGRRLEELAESGQTKPQKARLEVNVTEVAKGLDLTT